MPATDPWDLDRFVRAQRDVYADVQAELRAGHKRGHWMWFVFPQLRGLGSSPMSERYGLASLDEARAYAAHPCLGPRLVECTRLALGSEARSARALFGTPDDLKFRSSMTLFHEACPDERLYAGALGRYFGGESDPLTMSRLARR